MLNGDSLELFRAIGELKSELKEDLSEVKSQNATQLEKIIGLRNELLGDGGRVTNLEIRLDRQELWHNIKTVVVIPVIFSLHKLAAFLGWNI